MLSANDAIGYCLRRPTALLVGLLLGGLAVVGGMRAAAQVHIDQVDPVTSRLDGVTQGQLVVTMPGDCTPDAASCENVTRSDVLGLVPGITPALPSSDGNSAVVVQRGDGNEATVEQNGGQNEASVTQEGPSNDASVRQFGPGAYDNLAVLVQLGAANSTSIRQRGANNLAGIRLEGTNNGIQLTQNGEDHKYLLDFEGSGLGTRSEGGQGHRVHQMGTDNHLVQVGEGRMPFNVRQRGTGMRMIIRHTP